MCVSVCVSVFAHLRQQLVGGARGGRMQPRSFGNLSIIWVISRPIWAIFLILQKTKINKIKTKKKIAKKKPKAAQTFRKRICLLSKLYFALLAFVGINYVHMYIYIYNLYIQYIYSSQSQRDLNFIHIKAIA